MEGNSIFNESGIIITIILITIPVLIASMIVFIKGSALINNFLDKRKLEKFNAYLKGLSPEEIKKLEYRKTELEFSLNNNELSGDSKAVDSKGLISNVSEIESLRFIE